MIQQRHINWITRIEDAQGKSIMDHPGIEWELVSYYQDLLTKLSSDRSKAITKIM
jgi:hypothetical protein